MKSAILTLALGAALAGTAIGQNTNIEVPVGEGSVELSVEIIPGVDGDVALAAEREDESDGMMVLPLPGSDYELRRAQSQDSADVTRLVHIDKPNARPLFADSVCISAWNAEDMGAQQLVSMIASREAMDAWSQRHMDGLMMMGSVFPPLEDQTIAPSDPSASASKVSRARTTWSDMAGIRHEVMTRQRNNEKRGTWLSRHSEAVKAFAAIAQPGS